MKFVIRALRGYFGLALVLALAAGLAAFAQWGQGIDEDWGISARTVGLQFAVLAAGLLSFVWLLFTDRFTLGGKMTVLGVGVVGLLGLVASIRRVGFDGSNQLIIDWRWSPTSVERLREGGRLTTSDSALVQLDPSLLEGPAFPSFFGSHRDGHVASADLPAGWSQTPPKELWRHPVGLGYAAFTIQGNLAVTIEQQGDREVVSAIDIRTGKDLWHHSYKALFAETMGGDGPRATPTIDGEHVFALGATGVLTAIELLTGKVLWSTNILKDANAENIEWGMSGSPLITDTMVVVNPGGESNHGLIAYDRSTGKTIWTGGDHRAGYSSPMLATLAGTEQILILDRNGLAGHDLTNGKERWRFPFPTFNGINVAQPLVLPDDRVFLSAGYGGGSLLLKVSRTDESWKADVIWQNKELRCKFTSPIYVDGHIYGLDEGILVALDAETGKRTWKKGRYGHGQILLVGDKLLVMAESGDVAIVEARPDKYVEVVRWWALPGDKTWNAPALAGKTLLVRNHIEMVGYEFAPPSPGKETAQN